MKLVKNNCVEMDWDVDGFINPKSRGFVAAVHDYNGVAVAFYEGTIFIHLTEDGKPALPLKAFAKFINKKHKEQDIDYPEYYEDYALLYDGGDFNEELLDTLGIAEFKDDMLSRIKDLSLYWDETLVPLSED